jgi:hypothetical protein
VIAVLRALERTGVARAAAKDAGIDWSTAYQRRKAHAEFAEAWEEALRLRSERRKKEEEEEEIAAIGSACPLTPLACGESTLSREGRGAMDGEVIVSNGQVKRVGNGRWGKRTEKIFFDELAATANARMAAAAVGLSKNAVLQRRLRHPLFAAKWDAVVRTARASIDLYLVEEANKSFDPEDLETGEVTPKVSIDQAIKISQIGASKARREAAPDPFEEEAAAMGPGEVDQFREKMVRKLMRLRDRERRDCLAKGWTLDEENDRLIPPGWVKQGDP